MSVPPALPLIIVIFVAFALLVVSVISAPIVKDIPIGSVNGVHFGIFGSCKQSTCSQYSVGYQSGNEHTFFVFEDCSMHSVTTLTVMNQRIMTKLLAAATPSVFLEMSAIP